jgi:hypothetical protein
VNKAHPVSARPLPDGSWLTTGLDFSDYARCQTQQRNQQERRLATPTWAVNNPMLRDLITTFMEERAGFRKPQTGPRGGALTLRERLDRAQAYIRNARPRMFATLDKLCKEYVKVKREGIDLGMTDAEWNMAQQQPCLIVDDPGDVPVFESQKRIETEATKLKSLAIEIEGLDTYLRITKTGGADFIAAIVYLYYRTGMDSVGVGAELGLKPPHVRQTLWKLHETWTNKLADKYSSHQTSNDGASREDDSANRKSARLNGAELDAPPLLAAIMRAIDGTE